MRIHPLLQSHRRHAVLAGAHRVFMDLKSAITGNDDDAIIAEVERGEDLIKHKFEEAMSDSDLSQRIMRLAFWVSLCDA